MMNQEALENMVRNILQEVNSGAVSTTTSSKVSGDTLTVRDYPLGTKRPELVKTSTSKSLDDITLKNVLDGTIKPEDVRVTAETLKMQAQVARDAGRATLANNFERAAELTIVPDERILEIYNAMRPYRSSKEELLAIADELENVYNATICSNYVREAAQLYQERKKLKGDN